MLQYLLFLHIIFFLPYPILISDSNYLKQLLLQAKAGKVIAIIFLKNGDTRNCKFGL